MSEKNPEFSPEENEIIDTLGSRFSLQELTNAQVVLQQFHKDTLSPEISQIIEAIKRKAESIFYAFLGTDELAEELGDGEHEGISLHQRVGNNLKSIWSGRLVTPEKVLKFLQENEISVIYTGHVGENFLGLQISYIVEHGGFDCEVRTLKLDSDYISQFNEAGIQVIQLLELT